MDTVVVTGGNGKIGEAILRELQDREYRAVNLARGKRREDVSDSYFRTDLLNAGEVYGSLARSDADAIIHMGTIPSPRGHPGWRTYESNAMSTYHVLEAATELGLDAACVASSINAIGYDFQDANTHVEYLPVDEEHPVTPRDPYAISKHAIEVTADGFGRTPGAPTTISSLRYPAVLNEEQLRARDWGDSTTEEIKRTFDDSANDLFTYIHLDDAAAIAVDAVEADYRGHEVFWAVAADTVSTVPTPELIEAVYPETELRESLTGHDGLISIEKARTLLDWEPEYSWRDL
jgi:nucleoside-diphosphate-sugar epimerase